MPRNISKDNLIDLFLNWLVAEKQLCDMPHYDKTYSEVTREARELALKMGLIPDDFEDILSAVTVAMVKE